MSQRKSEFDDLGRPLVAISVDSAEDSREFTRKKSLTLPLLSDADRKVMSAYGVADADTEIAVPSVFVVSKAGVVIWCHVGETQMDRPSADVILEQLRKGL